MNFDQIISSMPPDFLVLAIQLSTMLCVVALLIRQSFARLMKIEGKGVMLKAKTKELKDKSYVERQEIARLKGLVTAQRSNLELLSARLELRG
jgi:hypothetical protein